MTRCSPLRSQARVVVLAGPSGSGKSRLAAATGLPVLRLDDFYRSGDDPALPLIDHGANAGLVDWDDPRSWHADEAVRAICELAATGRTVAPVYDISRNGPSGTHVVDLAGARLFVAEGIFAQEIVAACAEHGVLGRGPVPAPAPARHLLAAAHPRPARAPQAPARPGTTRLGADARPAARSSTTQSPTAAPRCRRHEASARIRALAAAPR